MSSVHGEDVETTAESAEGMTTEGAVTPPRWHAALLVMVLLAVALAGYASRGTTAPLPADADEASFSAERAARAAAPIVESPRPMGTPANDRAREALAAQLDALGFEITGNEGIGSREVRGEATAGYVRNLVATRPGSDPTGTLVLATHIDSVPRAPGAADAGVGLAVILETVRALGPEALRNDLVVLLVDGEERGLLGAEQYLSTAADQLAQPVAVLNHEARGISGRPLVTRTRGPMHAVIGAAPHPEFESFSDALFALIPNDTDFTVYRQAGWWGMDMAIIDEAWAYHSAQDDAEHLDDGTLQHYGEMTLAYTRELGDRDLQELAARSGEDPVQTTAPWGVVQIPALLVTVLGVLAPLAVLAAVLVRRRRGEVSVRGVLLAAVLGVVVLAAAVLAGVQLWQLTARATPEMLSQTTREPVRAELFLLAELMAAAAVASVGWVLARLLLSRAAVLLGAALLITALLAGLAVYSPALGGSMLPPAVLAAAGILLGSLLPAVPGLVVRALALAPTGWMLGSQLQSLGEFGIASSAGGLAGTALIGLGAAGPLLLARPAAGGAPVRRRRRLLIPVLPVVLALALVVGGTAWTQASPEPVQEQVTAHVNGADGETRWEVSGSTEWGIELDGTRATSRLELPEVATEQLGEGVVQIDVTAPRDGSALTLLPATGRLADVAVDGTEIASTGGLTSLQIHGVRAGQRVRVTATVSPGAELTVLETAYDPSLAGGWVPPGPDVSLMQPRTEVSVTVRL